MTTSRSRGKATVTSLRLCSRAPRTTSWSWGMSRQVYANGTKWNRRSCGGRRAAGARLPRARRDVGATGRAYPRCVTIRGRPHDRRLDPDAARLRRRAGGDRHDGDQPDPLPSERALIPTETWPWTSDGVGVVPIAPGSVPAPATSSSRSTAGRSRTGPPTPLARRGSSAPAARHPCRHGRVRHPSRRRTDRAAGAAGAFSADRLGGAPLGLLDLRRRRPDPGARPRRPPAARDRAAAPVRRRLLQHGRHRRVGDRASSRPTSSSGRRSCTRSPPRPSPT